MSTGPKKMHGLTKFLFFLEIVSGIIIVLYILSVLHIIPDSWYQIPFGIFAIGGIIGGFVQVVGLHNNFQVAAKDFFKAHLSILVTCWRFCSSSRIFLWLLLFLLLTGLGGYYLDTRLVLKPNPLLLLTPTAVVPPLLFSAKTLDGQQIGISDGRYAFDVQGRDGSDAQKHRDKTLKIAGAEAFAQSDYDRVKNLWHNAVTQYSDSDDAELLIYLENLRVIQSGQHYVTFIVATQLTGSIYSYNTGRDNLQGAYVAQKEFNSKANSQILIRLLIANVSDQPEGARAVAARIQQQAVRQDPTIRGIIGWPGQNSEMDQALSSLCLANMPLVTISPNDITGQSYCKYHFSVAPSSNSLVEAGVHYAKQSLHAKRVSIVYDPANVYSQNLVNRFIPQFTHSSSGNDVYRIVDKEAYTQGNAQSLLGLIHATLRGEPDLIYFAGYPNDIQSVLSAIPSNINVMGTDVIYQAPHYTSIKRSHGSLYFTAFAYPDEWSIFRQQMPAFVNDYQQDFDPFQMHGAASYGYSRANNDVLISYDALMTLLMASQKLIDAKNVNFSVEELRADLATIQWQGMSGYITFDAQGNTVNKAVIILSVDEQGRNHYESIGAGCYQQCS